RTRFSRDWSSDVCSSDLSSNDKPTEQSDSKYRPPVVRATYACISEQCGLQVVVEVSPPRLDAKWVQLLTDEDRIKKRLEELKARSEERRVGKWARCQQRQ